MDYTYLKDLFDKSDEYLESEVTLKGWIRNHRKQSCFGFIFFSDGTCFKQLQLVYEDSLDEFEKIQKYRVGSSIEVKGIFTHSEGKGQDFELKVKSIKLLGDCDEDYPIQPKPHSMEFLREQAYLRFRTNTFQAVFRVRSVASMAIHKYFQDRDYIYAHTPIFTASDCEGAGEMFQVTTQNLDEIAST